MQRFKQQQQNHHHSSQNCGAGRDLHRSPRSLKQDPLGYFLHAYPSMKTDATFSHSLHLFITIWELNIYLCHQKNTDLSKNKCCGRTFASKSRSRQSLFHCCTNQSWLPSQCISAAFHYSVLADLEISMHSATPSSCSSFKHWATDRAAWLVYKPKLLWLRFGSWHVLSCSCATSGGTCRMLH